MTAWTRRRWLHNAGLSAAGLMLRGKGFAQAMRMARPVAKTLDALKLPSFVDRLPLPVLQKPIGRQSSARHEAVDALYYPVRIREVRDKLHRDLPPTHLWGYGSTAAPVLFEVQSNEGVLIDWINELSPDHILPLDPPMKGMESAPPTRTATHLHGARVPSISDGYPEQWYAPGQNQLCFYPNGQEATALWMHDHAMGVNRFNVFAGLMGLYLIRDDAEKNLNLPSGKYELPLLIYDRSLDPSGQLYYPNPPDEGAWSQEFLGDAMLVNGKIRPYHEVEARRYRLRVANTANSRFFSLSLSNGQNFYVIGTDQGLLPSPVEIKRLVLSPSERADLIVDFSTSPGENIELVSDALELMQFRVGREKVADNSDLPKTLRLVPRISEQASIRTRVMTLNQFDDDNGMAMTMLLNRKRWADPVTERVKLNSTEIWSLANLTEDTHPIHLHLVRFQILDRRTFSVEDYLAGDARSFRYTEDARPSPQYETGWKDVVQCPPGTVTRIIIPFHGYVGRYLWHCHILEHEANEMMRPYEVI